MAAPSTDWKEVVADDEAARFARQSDQVRAAHKLTTARYGQGRFLHRKVLVGVRAEVEILADLPAEARFGARPARLEASPAPDRTAACRAGLFAADPMLA